MVSVSWLADAKWDLLVLDNMSISLQVNTSFCGEEKKDICGQGVTEGGGSVVRSYKTSSFPLLS